VPTPCSNTNYRTIRLISKKRNTPT